MTEVGANAKMNEFCAIMGLCNLKHVKQAIAQRKVLREAYERQLKGVPGIRLFEKKPEVEQNYGYFPILVDDGYPLTRDELYEKLKKQGIYTRKYFYPLTSDQACFKNWYRAVELERARELAKKVLVLPVYEGVEVEKLECILEIIK